MHIASAVRNDQCARDEAWIELTTIQRNGTAMIHPARTSFVHEIVTGRQQVKTIPRCFNRDQKYILHEWMDCAER